MNKSKKALFMLIALIACCIPQEAKPTYSWKQIAGGVALIGGIAVTGYFAGYFLYEKYQNDSIKNTIDLFCDAVKKQLNSVEEKSENSLDFFEKMYKTRNSPANIAHETFNVLKLSPKQALRFFTISGSNQSETYLEQKMKSLNIKPSCTIVDSSSDGYPCWVDPKFEVINN